MALLAGTDFGTGNEGWFCLASAISMEMIEEGVEKIAAWFKMLKR